MKDFDIQCGKRTRWLSQITHEMINKQILLK